MKKLDPDHKNAPSPDCSRYELKRWAIEQEDWILTACLDLQRIHDFPWDQALVMAVIELSKSNKQLRQLLIDKEMSNPSSLERRQRDKTTEQ